MTIVEVKAKTKASMLVIRNIINARHRWIRAMNGVSKIDRITNEDLRRRLDIESIMKIMDRRRMKWLKKLVNMPATQSDHCFPRMLLGAWIFQGKRARGRPLNSAVTLAWITQTQI